ncbi:MAG: TlyA family RNA methyltransferase [Ruminococcus sp.]
MSRLDLAVVQCGLAPSRQRAKVLIQNGQILVNGKVCNKPAFSVTDADLLTMEGTDIPFVGRGGLKLEHAMQTTQWRLDGLVCMDIGASTGGFTDCMLQHGAAKVYAVDVGHDQLAPTLREDSRVVNWEGTDIRQVRPEQMEEPIDFFSVDVSFISLHHVLPAAVSLLRPGGRAVILIKPQFEAGRENIGKNGLVLSQKVHCRVLAEITELFRQLGLAVQLLCPSPIQGGSGNVEYLAAVEKGAAETVLPDIAELAAAAFAAAKKEKTG